MTAHSRHIVDCDLLPQYTAAYLRVAGDECAFVETHTSHAVPKLLAALAARGLHTEQVRWIVVTHAHLDHAAGAGTLLGHCANATLLAHPRAARHLVDPQKLIAGATAVYGPERFAELYGTIAPIPQDRVLALDDAATFALGGATLRVHHTAGHANHHFVVEDPALDTVYTGDAFGLVYPRLQRGTRFAFPSTSPTGFDAPEAHRSVDKILSLGMSAACLTHYDEVRDLAEVAAQLHAWIDRSEAWVQAAAATERGVDAITADLRTEIRAAMVEQAAARGLALGPDDHRWLALDVELNAQGLAHVADKRRSG